MSVRSRQVPLVKYTDPQLKAGEHPLPDRLYTGLIWCLLLFVCLGGCLYYAMTKPIIITSANVSGEEHYDLNEMITLSVNPSDTENCVIFSVPAGVQASDIVTENLYNEKRFLVHINTDSDRFYGSLNDSGISVDAGRISGDASLVANASVIYDRTGALLVFDLTGVYEYTLGMEDNTVTMQAVSPCEMYDFIVVMDPDNADEAAGVLADVCERSAGLLDADGIRVYMTDPGHASLVTPAELVEETGADIYIGAGLSHDGADHHGIRTWYDPMYYIPGFGSIELSESVLKNTAIAASNRALGINEAPAGSILYEINVPAVYVTLGNADDAREYELLTDDSYRDRLAKGLYDAVIESARAINGGEA